MIALARKTLAYEWRRFLPVVLAMFRRRAADRAGSTGAGHLRYRCDLREASSADIWAGSPAPRASTTAMRSAPTSKATCAWTRMSPASNLTSGLMANGAPARRVPATCRCTCPASPPRTTR